MKKLKEKLNKKMPDDISAFIILGIYTVMIIAMIVAHITVNYKDVVPTNVGFELEETNENSLDSIEDLTSTENIDSIEELQKLNEKELEEAAKKDDKEEKKNKEQKIDTSKQYYIKVNYGAQVVTIYEKDSEGKYTVPVKAMVCSTGTYTPTGGVYKAPAKIRWCHMIGDVYAQYCTQIVGNILFHSVPYLRKGDHSSLEYWEYDKLGTRASMGCIRLTCADAKWIYDNCSIGTQVEFYSSSNPGPLGKPKARKISKQPSNIRGWDPTDPVQNNPWKKYLSNSENEDNKKANVIENEPEKNNEEVVNKTIVNVIIDENVNVEVNETLPDENVNVTVEPVEPEKDEEKEPDDEQTNNGIIV